MDERTRRALERADAMLDSLDERTEQRRRAAADERWREHQHREEANWERLVHPQPQPQPEPAPAPAKPTMDPETSAAWNRWADRKVKALVDDEIVPLAREIGTDLSGLQNRIRELEDRLVASESATVSLLIEAEGRIAALEQRAIPVPKPRLVAGGGSDAA